MNLRNWITGKPDRYLTVKVITDTGATTRNYVVSLRTLRRLKVAGVAAAVLLVVGVIAIGDGIVTHRRLARIQARNQQLEAETQDVAALKDQLAQIWVINARLQRMLGAGMTEKTARAATPSLPWCPPLANWAGTPFRVKTTERPDKGVNLLTHAGALVVATANGVVRDIRWNPVEGEVLYIDHGEGVQSAYGRDLTIFVQPGERVVQGQTVGVIHSTDGVRQPMLYYRVIADGSSVNPLVAMTGLAKESPWYPIASTTLHQR